MKQKKENLADTLLRHSEEEKYSKPVTGNNPLCNVGRDRMTD